MASLSEGGGCPQGRRREFSYYIKKEAITYDTE